MDTRPNEEEKIHQVWSLGDRAVARGKQNSTRVAPIYEHLLRINVENLKLFEPSMLNEANK
jgi:hypothetical protein